MLSQTLKKFMIASCALLIAVVMVTTGWLLPIGHTMMYALPLSLLSLLHLAVAVSAFFKGTWVRRLAALTGYLTLGVWALMIWRVSSWCFYLLDLYGQLGWAFSIGMIVVSMALSLFFLPFALFLILKRGRKKTTSGNKASASTSTELLGSASIFFLLSLLLAGSYLFHLGIASAAEPKETLSAGELEQLSAGLLKDQRRHAAIQTRNFTTCAEPLSSGRHHWLLYIQQEAGVYSECLQSDTLEQQKNKLKAILKAKRPERYKLDLLSIHEELPTKPDLLAALALRPGLDGVCAEKRCLAPWQLITRYDYN